MLDDYWTSVAAKDSRQWTVNANEVLASWSDDIPEHHDWAEDTGESLLAKMPEGNPDESAAELMLATDEDYLAFTLLSAWRVMDLIEASVASLNRGNVVGASATARSAIEATMPPFILFERRHRVLTSMGKSKGEESLEVYLDGLERLLYGSSDELTGIPRMHVNSVMDRFLKLCKDDETKTELRSTYNALCEVVHPSAMGHHTYWVLKSVAATETGQRLMPLSRTARGPVYNKVGENVIWAVAWSGGWMRRVVRAAIHDTTVVKNSRGRDPGRR